jgi:hypothetical protein
MTGEGYTEEKLCACNATREFFEFIPRDPRDERREGETNEDYAARLCKTFGFSAVSFEVLRRETFWNH